MIEAKRALVWLDLLTPRKIYEMIGSMEPAFVIESVGAEIASRYRIERVLGQGGMGAVYCVTDTRSGQKLALKRTAARSARKQQKYSALLEREYHILAQLAHPGIVEVYDFGVDPQGPYYTMELLEGENLSRSQRWPWQRACAVLRDVASALAMLHSRGLVHRDVSANNVRHANDGRVKLIDFGAMTSMGVAKEVVGTPPFMAPEVLQLQTLDGRADLFSLGALGYYLLTGRHAYPARRLSELRDAWRSRVPSPQRVAPEIPAELSSLIEQLIAVDRSARPRSAGEVMERLSAIAGLPREVNLEVSRAYLTTPTLIGREQALVTVRREMLSLVRGDGAVVLVRGVGGSGRSRMLDACALEGKLVGGTIVRADASQGPSSDWSVARALGSQLIELLPDQAMEAARVSRDVLSQLLEGLRDDRAAESAAPADRSLMIRALRDFVLSIARSTRLVLVIDDVDRIDEPSAAMLAALAHKTERHAFLLALAIDSENEQRLHGPLRLLQEIAAVVQLEQLHGEQTEALMRSVFGDVANVSMCAGRIQDLSQGNPRAAMELAQHLVDRGLARYEAGSWSLPAKLAQGELPATLTASLLARVERVGNDARELLEILALADRDPVQTSSFAGLTDHHDSRRMFTALHELVAARLLMAEAERYCFAQRGTLLVVRDTMPAARRVVLHARLADLLAGSGGDVLRRAEHLLGAQRDLQAIELLRSISLLQRLPPIELLTTAVERAEVLELPLRARQELRIALLSKASLIGADDTFRRWWPTVVGQLENDSGLTRYRALAALPETERLQQAVAQTRESYLATPEIERGHSVPDALRELARLAAAATSMANLLYDLELVESIPALDPFSPLSPVLRLVTLLIEASGQMISAKHWSGLTPYREVLARIEEPDRAGLDEAQLARTRLGVQYALAALEATQGIAVEQRLQILESDRGFRVSAWRVRMLMHLAQGNTEEARKCGRRAELLQLQEGAEERYASATLSGEVIGHALAGDLLGLKSKLELIDALAAAHAPGWGPIALYAHARYRQLQGDLDGALQTICAALEHLSASRHGFYCYAAAVQIELLEQLGRIEEAVARAREHLANADREQVTMSKNALCLAAAPVLARSGDHTEALFRIEWSLEQSEQVGRSGFALGRAYEVRARIAAHMRDQTAFDDFSKRCTVEYAKTSNASLVARGTAMIEQAQRVLAGATEEPLSLVPPAAAELESQYDTIHSRMVECLDQSDRGRCALTLLLQSTVSCAGYLCAVHEGGAKLLAVVPDGAIDEDLLEWLDGYVEAELSDVETALEGEDATATRSMSGIRFVDAQGRHFEAVPLAIHANGESKLVAVLALEQPGGQMVMPPRQLCVEIAASLLTHGDAAGVQLDG